MTFAACKTSKYIFSHNLRQMRLRCITRRQYCLLNLSLMRGKTLVAVLSSSGRQRLLVVIQRKGYLVDGINRGFRLNKDMLQFVHA